jgi:hypothetical protein
MMIHREAMVLWKICIQSDLDQWTRQKGVFKKVKVIDGSD